MKAKTYTARKIVRILRTQDVNNFKFLAPLGVELECFVYDENGVPVDLTQHLEVISGVPGVWQSGTDLGKNMLEIAFKPMNCLEDYLSSMEDAFYFLLKDKEACRWHFLFRGKGAKTIGNAEKKKYVAAINALKTENPKLGEKTVVCMTNYAALQVNVGVEAFGGIFSEIAKKLVYVFSNCGPALSFFFEYLFSDFKSERLRHAYSFVGGVRGPRYMPWEFCERLEEELYNIPQLISKSGSGEWRYCGKRPRTINPVHTGKIFWLARPQGVYDKTSERVEIRSLSSVTPWHSVYVLEMIDLLVRHIARTDVKDLYVPTEEEWKKLMYGKRTEDVIKIADTVLRKINVL